ncbi:MAG: hypothetical protein IKN68_01320 [Spirochaetia bacterium]|nr:hypothetical protein [Spirochaetia bacterium]
MIWFPLGVFALLIILGLTFIPASKRSSGFIFSCVLALLVSFLVSFLYSFIKNCLPLTDDTHRILVHYMVHDHLFFYFPGAAAVMLCMLCLRKEASIGESRAICLVLSCFYMLLAMLATFFYSPHGYWADPYFLFFLTGSRVLQCIVIAFAVPMIIIKPYQFWKLIPALIVLSAVPFVTAFVSYLYYTCQIHQSLILLLSLCGAALAAVVTPAVFLWRHKA